MATTLSKLKLSKKAKHFIKHLLSGIKNHTLKVICLEGTTQSGKTTDTAFAIIPAVMMSTEKYHIIAGRDVASIEKNYINDDKCGILAMYENVRYFGRGDKSDKRPHLKVYMPDGSYKIIRIMEFKNADSFEPIRNGVFGIIVGDEINLANDRTFSEMMARARDCIILSLNPDDPNKTIYKTINHCRPLPQYEKDYPEELLNELNLEPRAGWEHWYFTFDDNASLSPERIHDLKTSIEPDSPAYLSLILGVRQRSEGLCYPSFSKKIIWTEKQILEYLQKSNDKFIKFSAGLDTSFSGNTYDTNAMMFIGITEQKKMFILEEKVLSNLKQQREGKALYCPSDICLAYKHFCDECCVKWHSSMNEIYIDAADNATYTQWDKTFSTISSGYILIKAFKHRYLVNDRVVLVDGWMRDGDYIINSNCTEHIGECRKYRWDEKSQEKGKKKPVDKDNHTIDSCAYAWIPWTSGLFHMVGNEEHMKIWGATENTKKEEV